MDFPWGPMATKRRGVYEYGLVVWAQERGVERMSVCREDANKVLPKAGVLGPRPRVRVVYPGGAAIDPRCLVVDGHGEREANFRDLIVHQALENLRSGSPVGGGGGARP